MDSSSRPFPEACTNPLHDAARLEALRRSGLLAPDQQEKYDRFARLAARLLGAPTALVSVVEPHRQFFASAVGLAEPWASRRETPLSHSFCQHVVTSRAPLVVQDARAHPLVADNAAVRDLGVIAYLGVPLCAPSGEVLGSLCAIDSEPRAWSDEDLATLRDLTAVVTDELALAESAVALSLTSRHLAAETAAAEAARTDLNRKTDLLNRALDGAPLLLSVFDAEGTLTMSRGQALERFSSGPDQAVGTSVFEIVEPGSEAERGFRNVLAGRPATWTACYGGDWLETTASPTADGGGVAVSVLVTQRVLAEGRAEAQTENLRRLVTAAATQGTFEERAAAALREVTAMLGLDGGLLATVSDGTYTCLASCATAGDTLPPGDTLPLGDTYCALTMEAGDLVAIEHMAASVHCEHRCYQVVGVEAYIGVPVWVDGEALGALSFSSARPAARPFTAADRELVRLAGLWAGALLEREAREQTVRSQAERLRTLADAFALHSADDHDALARVLDRLRELLALDIGIVGQATPEADRYEVLACAAPEGVPVARGDVLLLRETYCSIAMEAGGVLAIDHMGTSPHQGHPCYGAFGLEAYIGAPVYVDGEMFGTLNFSSPAPREAPFSDVDRDLVLLAARWVGGLLAASRSGERQGQAERTVRKHEAELALVQRALPDALVVADPDRRVRRVNPAFSRLFGYTPEDVVGEPTRLLYAAPESFQATGQSRFNPASGERLEPYVVAYRRKDGSVFSGETVGTPIRDAAGTLQGYIGLIRDVTEREEQRRQLAESEAKYRLLSENASDLVCLHAPDGTYEWVSPSVTTLLRYQPDDLIGQRSFALFHPDEVAGAVDLVQGQLLRGEQEVVQLVHRFRHRDGHYIWIESHTRAIRDDDGAVLRLRTAARDVTERQEMENRLFHQAHHDALTGLANRTLFTARLTAAIEAEPSADGLGFAVLFLDLDRFKVINDTLGHSVGDRLLQKVADRLRRAVRDGDTVARLGGDEFAILLEGLPTSEYAEGVAGQLQEALAAPVRVAGRAIAVGASVGVVNSRPDHASPDAILQEADLAMYVAKSRGRSTAATYSPGAFGPASRRLRLESDLPTAVEQGEFRVVYQPIVRLADGALAGFEALVRWEHPEFGLLSPGEFIGAAEESGLVTAIDQWVLHEVGRQAAAWQHVRGGRWPLLISVNCTGRDLLDETYAAVVDGAIGRLPEPVPQAAVPQWLALEITEGLLIEDPEAVAAEVERLQRRGVRFSIDDFGTGYSSLSTLLALPVDTIKVDRSFVNEIEARDESRKLVETVVGLGRLLNKSVVAEGIETDAHLASLRRMGCAYGQGYLFAKPLGVEPATALVSGEVPPWRGHWAA